MTAAVDFGASLEEQCEQIWEATLAQERKLQDLRDAPPVTFVFDGHQNLQHILLDVRKLHCEDLENDTGVIELEIEFSHPVAQWLHDRKGAMARGEGELFHIDVEKNGVRLTGRYESKTVRRDKTGRRILVITCLTDYENLKWIDCWCNPFLPFIFQFPRLFLLAGPAIWVLKTALFLNLWRIFSSVWQIPDDPLNPLQWLTGSLNFSDWDIVVKPTTFLEDMAAGTSHCVFFSRFGKWHDRSKMILADAELSVVTRRLREGDPEPWEGAFLMGVRPGQLVVDIVDKSGHLEGRANGGTWFDGMTRGFREFTTDFAENIETELLGAPSWPSEFLEEYLGTPKGFPVAHFPADAPGAAETEFTETPAKGSIINTGGESAPGIDEGISAGIQLAGDAPSAAGLVIAVGGGASISIPPLGGAIDAILKPFYQGTVLAWISVKLLNRIQQSGSSRYLEYFIDAPGKAYTLSSLMVIRTAVYATERKKKKKATASSSTGYVIGWPGSGHFYKGDQGSFEIAGDETGEIHVERAMKTSLDWERDHFAKWEAEFGLAHEDEDPIVTLTSSLAEMADIAQTLGVW
ncbi:minor tail protein [Gordonia phage GEazy]|nr:minor tail protein [Gordonia phage GEazy]QDF16732.1 minor tail protein [Gordonia phage HannahD]